MRLRGAIALAAAAAALAGCSGSGGGTAAGDLVWVGSPRVFTPPDLPGDRILSGRVRNDSLRRVDVTAKDLRLVDADGRAVEGSSAVFLATFAHQLFPPTREPPGGIPERELVRLGVKAKVEPGKEVPLTMSWRQRPGAKPPVRVDTGGGSLPLP